MSSVVKLRSMHLPRLRNKDVAEECGKHVKYGSLAQHSVERRGLRTFW